MEKGLIHVYYGGGKGKTTCGMGLCIRAAGAGLKVLIVQSTGSFEERKKVDQYFLQAGSCLRNRFEGDIYEVGVGMPHPVYRYGKPLFWKL